MEPLGAKLHGAVDLSLDFFSAAARPDLFFESLSISSSPDAMQYRPVTQAV